MKTITVNVTQRDIDQGVRADARHCPIAKAMLRLGFAYPAVCSEWASLDGRHVTLPDEAAAFVESFDNYLRVAPFSFSLTLEA